MTLPFLFLVKSLLQSTYIIATWPQLDLNFLPLFIDTEKNPNKILQLPVVFHLCPHLRLFVYLPLEVNPWCLKPCISPSCHLWTWYNTRMLLHDMCLLLPNTFLWSAALKSSSYLAIYPLKPVADFQKWQLLTLRIILFF